MSSIYSATVLAAFVTTFIATNVLVAGVRGRAVPGLFATLRTASRRLSRRIKHLADGWAAAMIARRERQATICALRYLSDRDLKDIGVYRGGLGTLVTDRRREQVALSPANNGL